MLPFRRLLATAAAAGAVSAVWLPLAPRAQTAVPTPATVIGWEPCADYKLATYEQIADYFRRLDAATDRMETFDIGKTAEGRTQIVAIISSEANMKQLARWKEISRRLALARNLTDDRARSLATEGKAIVWIDFGLHSNEVAHAQAAPLVAWKAVTDESAEMKLIRDEVVFILVPNMNPDGTTIVSSWYMKNVGTAFENSPTPTLYHKYVGHDNNRDWFMFNMPETRNIARQLYQEWFPQIVYNQHQTGPFPARIFIPPFDDPMNPNIPPLVMRGINEVGAAMARRFSREGKAGVVSRIQYDTWWNGGMRSAPYFHNMVGILTEAQHSSATPATYDPKRFPRTFANGESTLEPSTFYPHPWRGGEWHLRDTCEYMVTGSMAVLDIGAKRRQEWLYDIYQMGRDSIRAGADETYLIAPDQWDPNAATKLVNVLRWGGVEVQRATAPLTAGGRSFPAGTFIIPGAQPFRPHLTDLLNPQVYPDRRLYPGGPPERPYDITGWTLPYQMGVRVEKLNEAVVATAEPVSTATLPAGRIEGAGTAYVLDPRSNETFIAVNRLLGAGATIHRALTSLTAGTVELPPGAFIVSGHPDRRRLEHDARDLGLVVRTIPRLAPGEVLELARPRLGLYQAWGGNMDEGWTRWLFEAFEFPYATVRDADIRAGRLRKTLDVIVLPDATYDDMLSGLGPGTMPADYTGGMTARGIANLYDFVAEGGTLVTLGRASQLPITGFGLPIRDVTAGQDAAEFYVPGTIVNVTVDPSHPIAHGMPGDAAAFFIHSPAFQPVDTRNWFELWQGREARPPSQVRIVARYPARDLLKSGWLLGESVLRNRAAIVEAQVEKGRVVLIGFRPQHRGQTHGTFRLLFNAVLLGAAEKTKISGATM
jgi:hypothetical protein